RAEPLEFWRQADPQTGIVNEYGPTETTVGCTAYVVPPEFPATGPIPIGKPIANTQVLVLDEAGQPVPLGVAGELFISGTGVARGYFNQKHLTQKQFFSFSHRRDAEEAQRGRREEARENLCETSAKPLRLCGEEKSYRTGDVVRWLPSGELEYLGRKDEQVKLRGYRIELGEIEAVLRSHPGVAEAAVTLQQDSLVGFVVEKQDLQKEEILNWLRKCLPAYAIPSRIVTVTALPLLASGKLDRNRLLSLIPDEPNEIRELIEPRTETEKTVALVWQELLKVSRLDRGDNFFTLGGHSLLGTQLVSRLRGLFGIEIHLRDLFEAPTLEKLSLRIEELKSTNVALHSLWTYLPPFVRVPRRDVLPLSFAQERLWFLNQLEPGNPAYNIPGAIRLRVDFNLEAANQALCEILRRHEILRTTFSTHAGAPVQIIHAEMPYAIEFHDFSQTGGGEDLPGEVQQFLAQQARRSFDLASGPLLHVVAAKLGDCDFVLGFVIHHIVSDGWSNEIFVREFAALYDALTRKQTLELPELPLQYADFAVWQRNWLQGEVLEQQLAFWRDQLGDGPFVLDFPTDFPRPAMQTHRGARVSFELDASATAGLKRICANQHSTLFMMGLAVFQSLLHRYTGQETILVGTPVANRHFQEIEPLIGFFTNTLVFRTDFHAPEQPAGLTFSEVLQQVRETALAAFAHQDVPFEKIVEMLQPERDLSRSPLFQVMFDLRAQSPAEKIMGSGKARFLDNSSGTAKFDLLLALAERNETIGGTIEYNADLFTAATMERFALHFCRLAAAIAEHSEQLIARLPLLSTAEWQQMLAWNDTQAEFPRTATLHELFAKQVARTPEQTAVIELTGNEAKNTTYAELNDKAEGIAARLRLAGVQPETLVGVMVEASTDMLAAVLGILKTGAAFLPLEPTAPNQRLEMIVADAQPALIITQVTFQDRFLKSSFQTLTVDSLSPDSTLSPQSSVLSPEAVAYVIYTSGSTGKPKGVVVEHHSAVNLAWAMARRFALDQNDRVLQFASLSFDAAIEEIFPALISGAAVVVSADTRRRSFTEFHTLVEQTSVTVADLPTAFWHEWVRHLKQTKAAIPHSLRLVVVGGEKASLEVFRDWQHLAGGRIRWMNTYGPTETTVTATVFEPAPEDVPLSVLPIGGPLENVTAWVVDQYLNPLPIGIPGELCIGGEGVARGYLNQGSGFRVQGPGFEKQGSGFRVQGSGYEVSVSDIGPSPGNRMDTNPSQVERTLNPEPWTLNPGVWYFTGDIVRRLPNGALEYLGRRDRQVKIRGFRIELGEIEAVLLNHPDIAEAVVIKREEQLVAYITNRTEVKGLRTEAESEPSVLEEGSVLSPQSSVLKWLREHLPEYMLPAVIIELDELPRTASGKIDWRALPAPSIQVTETDEIPVGLVEELTAAIFATVLNRPSVSRSAGFFELGGHSLSATQVVSRLREAFGVELPLRALFEQPTVAGVAALVEQARRTQTKVSSLPPLVRADRGQFLPVSFSQERLWFLAQLEPDSPAYHIPTAVRLQGSLDVAALERALAWLAERHETLRTVFATVDGQPVQVIQPVSSIKLEVEPAAAANREALTAFFRQPFDLTCGPLLRVKVIQLEAEDFLLAVVLHHIVADGWSSGVFVRELTRLYAAAQAGRENPLPPLGIQYADYALWQRSWLSETELERHVDFWRQHLADAPPLLELPTDFPRPAQLSFRGGQVSLALDETLSRNVKTLAHAHHTTLFMTLLAAYQVLLAKLSGQNTVVVGSPVAGRNLAELEPLIGFFVNTLALKADFQARQTFSEILAQVRQTLLTAFDHQDLPFERLVEALQPTRTLKMAPIFQAVFVFQNETKTPLEFTGFKTGKTQEILQGVEEPAKFDLMLTVREAAAGLQVTLDFHRDLFTRETASKWLGLFRTVLESVVSNPKQEFGRLAWLSDQDRAELKKLTAITDFPVSETLPQWFERVAAANPAAIAVTGTTQSGDREQVTYAELNQRANALAAHLQEMGVGPESRIAILLERTANLVVAMLAVGKAGSAYVPLDPTSPPERLAMILADAQPAALLTQTSLLNLLPGTKVPIHCAEHWLGSQSSSVLSPQSSVLSPEAVAYVIYTSGTTGRPKGVEVTHANVVRLLTATETWFGFDQSDVWTFFHSAAFDFSVWEMWGALLYGGRLVMVDYWTTRSAEAFCELLEREQVTVLNQTPTAFFALQRVIFEKNPRLNLRTVIFGGEALEVAKLRPWFEGNLHRRGAEEAQSFRQENPSDLSPQSSVLSPRLINMYGITETTVFVTYRPIRKEDLDISRVGSPIGIPIPDLAVSIVDANLEPVPVGVWGELCVGGAGVARGYLNRPELTAEKFKSGESWGSWGSWGSKSSEVRSQSVPDSPDSQDAQDPQDGLRWYRSGDIARWTRDGELEYQGRRDQQVKIRGFRIELGEIEAALLAHPGVAEAVVVKREERLVAYITARTEAKGLRTEAELASSVRSPQSAVLAEGAVRNPQSAVLVWLRERLPEYMVPSVVVELERLPVNANGKLDRGALP
ncbi:MAG: amino acid adenylation domain-containing protein, partial [Blastocatellia bacterium]|nr:amino acid adenylation domain-containing protein [Blastocatellia bacterium]